MQDYNSAEECQIWYEQNSSSDPAFCCPWRTAMHGGLKTTDHNYTKSCKF